MWSRRLLKFTGPTLASSVTTTHKHTTHFNEANQVLITSVIAGNQCWLWRTITHAHTFLLVSLVYMLSLVFLLKHTHAHTHSRCVLQVFGKLPAAPVSLICLKSESVCHYPKKFLSTLMTLMPVFSSPSGWWKLCITLFIRLKQDMTQINHHVL